MVNQIVVDYLFNSSCAYKQVEQTQPKYKQTEYKSTVGIN